jgi:hypothetical protein
MCFCTCMCMHVFGCQCMYECGCTLDKGEKHRYIGHRTASTVSSHLPYILRQNFFLVCPCCVWCTSPWASGNSVSAFCPSLDTQGLDYPLAQLLCDFWDFSSNPQACATSALLSYLPSPLLYLFVWLVNWVLPPHFGRANYWTHNLKHAR